nr:helix-turn-helix transcriptional regulator [Flavihumibacter rivuli]
MRNYSQEYVAKEMGISQNAYSKIENNITQLTVRHVKQISRILEVSMIDLLRDDFEIHRPGELTIESVSRDNLVEMLKRLQLKMQERHPQKHDFYPVMMSLLQAFDNSLNNVH